MRQLIAIIGMPGAGKSEASAFFAEKGMTILRFGSVIDDGLKEENKTQTPESEKYYREKIRKELGMAGIAIKMLPKIENAIAQNDVILDGLYSWEEYILLKDKFPNLMLLCMYARPEIRYKRLATRKIRPFTLEEAKKRDKDEIEKLNKGGPIAIADYLIKNETTTEDLHEALEAFTKDL